MINGKAMMKKIRTHMDGEDVFIEETVTEVGESIVVRFLGSKPASIRYYSI